MSALNNIEAGRLRSYSSAFSRNTFQDILRYDDYGHLDWLYHEDKQFHSRKPFTYLDYLQRIYDCMARSYRCEYVYKNEIIHHLIKQYRSESSVVFNEFRVGSSVADLAFFNGESKAFEIKTEFDSDKRLVKQLSDYCRLFDKCYLVIPRESRDRYRGVIGDQIGIVLLSYHRGHISLELDRDAKQNSMVDVGLLMSSCRTGEYESFVIRQFGALPNVPVRLLYSSCRDLLRTLPDEELRSFFIESVKLRRSEIDSLRPLPRCLRQICLSLNLRSSQASALVDKLNLELR